MIGGIVAIATLLSTAAAMAQTLPPSPPQRPDVVVEGLRDAGPASIRGARSAVPSALGYRKVAERAEFFAHCVRRFDLAQARAIVDGIVNSNTEQRALDQIVRANAACYPGYPAEPPPPPFFGDCNPTLAEEVSSSTSNGSIGGGSTPYITTCRAFYDRGALLLQLIERYAPDLALTTQQTSDRVVQARFDAVEVPRNRVRFPEDYRYFVIAVCLVRVQPVLASRLVHTQGAGLQDRIGRLILLRGRTCIGNAQHVRIEPAQFRLYITDAAYRWAVAAKGVTTLLPPRDRS